MSLLVLVLANAYFLALGISSNSALGVAVSGIACLAAIVAYGFADRSDFRGRP